MVNDNTPSPKRRRKRKVEKPRVTPRTIREMKLIARSNRRLLKLPLTPGMRLTICRMVAQLEQWIKAYGG